MNLRKEENLDRKRKNFENDILYNQFIDIFVAESENEIVALLILSYSHFSSKNVNYAEIKALYILPEFKNQRIGTKLLKYALKICKKKHCKYIILWVLEKNMIARNFYEKNLFINTKQKQKFSEENINIIKYLFKFDEVVHE